MTKPIRVSHQRGPYRVEAQILPIGEDLVVSIWGGTAPHVGALALAMPRPSLKDPATISSTASVLARVGHKEDDIVKQASERISAALNRVVAVAAGMHWDHIPDEDIGTVRLACEELAEKVIDRIQGGKR
jgi:hypothetical protein